MPQEKLRAWLKLPDGPWPPDHYALIGLPIGKGSPEEIEGRILERLELLRRYQLPHPDEATEGMNLLAQALDTLTDPDSRRAYDRSIGLKVVTKVEPPPLPADDVLSTLFPGVPTLEPAESEAPTPEPNLPEVILLPLDDDEPDVDDEPLVLPPATMELVPDAILMPVPPPVARIETETPTSTRPKSPRREMYADLARVRKVLRVFERARPYLTDADRTFTRRTDALALMGCLAELRPLLHTVPDLIAGPKRPGNLVAALARQRLLFDTFRSLLPDQRDALARDFRAAHYRLAAYYDDLRDEVRRRTEKDWTRSVLNPLLRYIADHPEWIVLPFALLALAIAVIRSV
ncbi:MAG TPA: hypothetical protein VHR66_20340 [Gemmataceae bacterium]|nr:hypothetical protein [Gemmataceae bacterium]